jgi:hypothetical protein
MPDIGIDERTLPDNFCSSGEDYVCEYGTFPLTMPTSYF